MISFDPGLIIWTTIIFTFISTFAYLKYFIDSVEKSIFKVLDHHNYQTFSKLSPGYATLMSV